MDRSLQLNRASWDERAALHAASKDYEVELLVQRPGHLSETVRFDLPLLGDIKGLNAVHLQCHIGTDTLSLARLGAQVCGLDYSAASLAEARALAKRCAVPIEYVESDVYAADKVLPAGTFDLVYTGIGALCWLPRIEPWARTVAALLKPRGRLFLRDGHPMLMAVNEDHHDRLQLEYPYFEHEAPTVWHNDQTYVETEQRLAHTETHEWNHGLGEVVTALLAHGLQLTALVEHQSIPWEALPGQMVNMRAILPMAAALMLVGCASATMETARGGKPTAQLDSHKAPELVAQCIQFSWQEEKVFGDDASGYLEPRKQGGFTVYTREAEAFVDVYPQAGGARVDYYAQKHDGVALQRRAAAATCL